MSPPAGKAPPLHVDASGLECHAFFFFIALEICVC